VFLSRWQKEKSGVSSGAKGARYYREAEEASVLPEIHAIVLTLWSVSYVRKSTRTKFPMFYQLPFLSLLPKNASSEKFLPFDF